MEPGRRSGEPRREPMLNAPAGVLWAIGLVVAIHAALELTSEGTRDWLKLAFAFIPARYSGSALELPGGTAASGWSFVTHQLVHADWAHIGLNCAWLLAFGGAVAARVGMVRFAGLGLASGVAGACLFLIVRWGEFTPMAGASGAVSGLMGAAFRFFFSAIDLGGLHTFRDMPRAIPRMTLSQTLADRRIQATIAFWLVLNLLTALAAPLFTSAGGIAWEAHIGGFAFGLLAFGFFDPPFPKIEPNRDEPVHPTLH